MLGVWLSGSAPPTLTSVEGCRKRCCKLVCASSWMQRPTKYAAFCTDVQNRINQRNMRIFGEHGARILKEDHSWLASAYRAYLGSRPARIRWVCRLSGVNLSYTRYSDATLSQVGDPALQIEPAIKIERAYCKSSTLAFRISSSDTSSALSKSAPCATEWRL